MTGEILYAAKPQLTQALGAAAALDATSVLSRGNGTRRFTGATAIWIGFDKPAVTLAHLRVT